MRLRALIRVFPASQGLTGVLRAGGCSHSSAREILHFVFLAQGGCRGQSIPLALLWAEGTADGRADAVTGGGLLGCSSNKQLQKAPSCPGNSGCCRLLQLSPPAVLEPSSPSLPQAGPHWGHWSLLAMEPWAGERHRGWKWLEGQQQAQGDLHDHRLWPGLVALVLLQDRATPTRLCRSQHWGQG